MFVRRLLAILTVYVMVCFPAMVCCAEERAVLAQVCPWEQNVDIYFTGDMELGNLSCRISNQTADIAGSGLLADRKASVRTTILVDTSMSMPSAVRGNVKLYLDILIKNIGENEQYKIVAFNEQLDVLQDFTADRYDLASAAEKIEFNGQKSKIYDAIYNTIPDVQPIDGGPCYYRTVIITDGIDDTESGITKEELYLKLQADTYPIDVVEVSKAEKAEPEKEISALMRISGGRYANLHPESDVSGLCAEFAVEDVRWVRAVVPGALLDGSTRQVDLSDGTASLRFDVKVPVYDVPAQTPSPTDEEGIRASGPAEEMPDGKGALNETVSPDGKGASDEGTSPDKAGASAGAVSPADEAAAGQADAPEPGESLHGGYLLAAAVGSAVCIIIIAGIFAIFIAVRGRKKKTENNGGGNSNTRNHDTRNHDTKNKDSSDAGGDTVIFPEGGSRNGNCHICLYNVDNPGQRWDVSFAEAIIIGRNEDSQICLTDRTVSHSQCRLYLKDYVPMIENLSKSNITEVNGDVLREPRQIRKGDRIVCGRVTIMVESLYDSGSGNDKLNKMTEFVNV